MCRKRVELNFMFLFPFMTSERIVCYLVIPFTKMCNKHQCEFQIERCVNQVVVRWKSGSRSWVRWISLGDFYSKKKKFWRFLEWLSVTISHRWVKKNSNNKNSSIVDAQICIFATQAIIFQPSRSVLIYKFPKMYFMNLLRESLQCRFTMQKLHKKEKVKLDENTRYFNYIWCQEKHKWFFIPLYVRYQAVWVIYSVVSSRMMLLSATRFHIDRIIFCQKEKLPDGSANYGFNSLDYRKNTQVMVTITYLLLKCMAEMWKTTINVTTKQLRPACAVVSQWLHNKWKNFKKSSNVEKKNYC